MLLTNKVFSTLASIDKGLALCQNPVLSYILGGVFTQKWRKRLNSNSTLLNLINSLLQWKNKINGETIIIWVKAARKREKMCIFDIIKWSHRFIFNDYDKQPLFPFQNPVRYLYLDVNGMKLKSNWLLSKQVAMATTLQYEKIAKFRVFNTPLASCATRKRHQWL